MYLLFYRVGFDAMALAGAYRDLGSFKESGVLLVARTRPIAEEPVSPQAILDDYGEAIRLLLRPDRPIKFNPGDYFHILFPGRPFGYNVQRSYPAVAEERLSDLAQAKTPEVSFRKLFFS
jgi:hypothetical protein